MSSRVLRCDSRIGDAAYRLFRRARRLCFPVGLRAIDSKLTALIGQRRECIFMHSSLSRCGYVRGGAMTVIEGVGRWCDTFCLPTHTYCYPKGSPPVAPVFDPRATESVVGQITNSFRRLPGALRSIHPTHSVAARGPRASDLIASHERCDTPCGHGTPYTKLIDLDASVLMFGASMNTYTLFHTAEDEAGCEYLYFADRCLLRVLDRANRVHEILMWRQNMDLPRRFAAMDRVLQEEGLLSMARLGLGQLLFVPSAQQTHAFLVDQLRKDPYYLVAERHRPPGTSSCK